MVLDHQPVAALLALVAVALNAVLCLAYIDYYKDMLVQHANTVDEAATSYDKTYAHPTGRTTQRNYAIALVPLILAAAFYTFLAKTGRNGEWVLATLIYPGFVLVAGRLHDMGQTGWLLLAPGLIVAVALGLHFFDAKASFTAPVGPGVEGVVGHGAPPHASPRVRACRCSMSL